MGFLIPVQRLRYKDSPSGTQRLIDVVAFKFREPPQLTTIAVSEVKTRTGKAASIVADAAVQLADAVDDLALYLSYIDRSLTEQGTPRARMRGGNARSCRRWSCLRLPGTRL